MSRPGQQPKCQAHLGDVAQAKVSLDLRFPSVHLCHFLRESPQRPSCSTN